VAVAISGVYSQPIQSFASYFDRRREAE
jgi:hypothetical protein